MDELSVTTDDIKDCKTHYFVATLGSIIAGFYALGELPGTEIELDAMFVEPDLIGSGVGKAMMHHARKSAALLGAARMIIQSDPNAEGFYRAAGGRLTGERESESIPGRFLPTLEIFLE